MKGSKEFVAKATEAKEAGDRDAINLLGVLSTDDENLKEARSWYTKAAEAGDSDAMYQLGMLSTGAGNLDVARSWHTQAAEAGNSDAMNLLGVLSADAGNFKEARSWYLKAADAGHGNAMHYLRLLPDGTNEPDEKLDSHPEAINTRDTAAIKSFAAFPGDSISRNSEIVKLRLEGNTLEEIGVQFGLSRERVRQIVISSGHEVSDTYLKSKRELKEQDRLTEHNQITRKSVIDDWERYNAMPPKDIARELNVTETALLRALDVQYRLTLIANKSKNRNAAKVFSDDDITVALKDAATYKFPLTSAEYGRLVTSGTVVGPSLPSVFNRFGSWLAACEAAGVEAGQTHGQYRRSWTEEDLYEIVYKFIKSCEEKQWTFAKFEKWLGEMGDDYPSGATIRNRIGKWSVIRAVVVMRMNESEFQK